MELASRVFDIMVENIDAVVTDIVPEASNQEKRLYWRKVLRIAALCHDIGHLPFSHTSEQLLPDNVDHETLTEDICYCTFMVSLFDSLTPPVRPEDVVKIALGPEKYDGDMSSWETLLSEIITGDSFGVDRMDYLLRDSHHLGVAYGNFLTLG